MDGGPFEFDNSEPTILKRSELEKVMNRFGGRKEKAEREADEKTAKKPAVRGVLVPARLNP
jgi:hypothetical protein